jgi:cation transport regulator ChaB
MPYASKDELPQEVKDKYSAHQQDIFLAAFNAAYNKICKDRKDRDACAFAIAHNAAQEGKQNMEKPNGKIISRMLNIELKDPKFVETDGGLLIKDITILAEGTWTDSFAQTPCHYSGDILKEYAGNWKANGYWLRHQGGSPRSIDEKVGEVRTPRYENGAVMGDVFLHLATTKSRDHAEMVKRGYANSVSAELGTIDEWDAAHKWYNAKYLEFAGVASVDRGACSVCKIKSNEEGEPPEVNKDMEKTELEQMLAGLKADIMGEMDKRFAAIVPPAVPDEIKGLSEKVESANKMLATYEERLKKIENAPDPKTFAPAQMGPSDGEKELEKLAAMKKLPMIHGRSIAVE